MHKLITGIFILTVLNIKIASAQDSSQSSDIGADYLTWFSKSFIQPDVSHRATGLFWSLCLGEHTELSKEELSGRYKKLIEDTAQRIAFYKRFNYYLSCKKGYYSDFLSLGKTLRSNNKSIETEVFDNAALFRLATLIHGYGQDPLLAGSWSSGPEGIFSDTVSHTPVTLNYSDTMPQFPGGDAGLISFLQKHIIYPRLERDMDVQGRIILKFRICEDGYLCTANAIKTVTDNLETEATRVLKMMPLWKPGKQGDKTVSVWYNLPIIFKLQ